MQALAFLGAANDTTASTTTVRLRYLLRTHLLRSLSASQACAC